MSADESLQKISFSPSEDEFLDEDEADSDDDVNLNRRISKMGKNHEINTNNKARKRDANNEKDKVKGKENSKRNFTAGKSRAKQRKASNVLRDSKRPVSNLTSGFITTRRLTTGLTGIFGNSRASDTVKRKGKRMPVVDLDQRKTSVAVKEQVSHNLRRILNPPPNQSKNGAKQETYDGKETSRETFVSASDKNKEKIHSYRNNYGAPSSSSSSGGSSARFITPVTHLLSETPILEISRNINESLFISNLFPGKRYIEEIKDELRKTSRQDCSLVDESANESSPESNKSRIAPITVSSSKHLKSFEKITREEASEGNQCTVTAPQEQRMEIQLVGYQDVIRKEKQFETANNTTSRRPIDRKDLKWSALDVENNLTSVKKSCLPSEPSPSFQIISRVTEPAGIESRNIDPTSTTDFLVHPCGLNQVIHSHAENSNQWKDCAVAVQRLPYSTSQLQQDSGTYSEESSARDKNAANSAVTISTNITCDKSNKDSYLDHLYCNEVNYPGHDDYQMGASNYDILHYAGMMGGIEEDNDIPNTTEISNPLNSFPYLPVPKKPCLETPTPPMQLFRLKMF